MTDYELKNKLIDIVQEMLERSDNPDAPNTELNCTFELKGYRFSINVNYEVERIE